MPKDKKPKAISLVSAYESGAESQTESESESEQTDSTRSSQSRSRSRDKSISRSPIEEVTSDGSKKRVRDEAENESQEGISMDYDDTYDEFPKKSKTEKEQVESKPSDEPAQTVESVPDEKPIETDVNFFSEQNGFLPGCENIKLPPATEAQCSQSLQNKIIQVLDRMENYNYSINNDIKNKKKFKNPSIYEKLIDAYGIDEFGSSFETHIDDLKTSGYMFYDELDQTQMAEWAKKDKERKERTKIEMVSGTKKK